MKTILLLIATLLILTNSKVMKENFVVTLSFTRDDQHAKISTSFVRWLTSSSDYVYPIHWFTDLKDVKKIVELSNGVVIYADNEDINSLNHEVLDSYRTILNIVISRIVDETQDKIIPLLVLGDADRLVLEALGIHKVDDDETDFKDTAVTPLFKNDIDDTSLFYYFEKDNLKKYQKTNCAYLNSNNLITFNAYNSFEELKNRFKINSFFIRDDTRYILSMSYKSAQKTLIEIIKFRPDMVTYGVVNSLKFYNIPSDSDSLRFNQKLAEIFSLRMIEFERDIREEFLIERFYKLKSEIEEDNNQYYYIFPKNEPIKPEHSSNKKIEI